MEKKIIFMDIDGTLCDQQGKVPISAMKAIKKARMNGHLVYICTGRSKPEITEDIQSIGFDGIIGAGGSYIEINNRLILHEKMPEKGVREVIDYFKKYNIDYYIESNDGLFSSPNCVRAIQNQLTINLDSNSKEYQNAILAFNWFYELLNKSIGKEIAYDNVNKISFISNGYPYEEVAKKFKEKFTLHRTTVSQFGSNSGEVSIKGVSKATAIEIVLKELDISKTMALAYGDGDNDIEMFNAVSYGVAMENATNRLLEIADEITPIAEENGIYISFSKNKLI